MSHSVDELMPLEGVNSLLGKAIAGWGNLKQLRHAYRIFPTQYWCSEKGMTTTKAESVRWQSWNDDIIRLGKLYNEAIVGNGLDVDYMAKKYPLVQIGSSWCFTGPVGSGKSTFIGEVIRVGAWVRISGPTREHDYIRLYVNMDHPTHYLVQLQDLDVYLGQHRCPTKPQYFPASTETHALTFYWEAFKQIGYVLQWLNDAADKSGIRTTCSFIFDRMPAECCVFSVYYAFVCKGSSRENYEYMKKDMPFNFTNEIAALIHFIRPRIVMWCAPFKNSQAARMQLDCSRIGQRIKTRGRPEEGDLHRRPGQHAIFQKMFFLWIRHVNTLNDTEIPAPVIIDTRWGVESAEYQIQARWASQLFLLGNHVRIAPLKSLTHISIFYLTKASSYREALETLVAPYGTKVECFTDVLRQPNRGDNGIIGLPFRSNRLAWPYEVNTITDHPFYWRASYAETAAPGILAEPDEFDSDCDDESLFD